MAKVSGNIKGIKNTIIAELESLYDITVPGTQLVSIELLNKMHYLTDLCKREIVIYLNRRGRVLEVALGDKHTATLPAADTRRSELRLSGIRCLHTHPEASSSLSSLDISSLKRLRYDCMVAVGSVSKEQMQVSMAYISDINTDGSYEVAIYDNVEPESLLNTNFIKFTERIEKHLATQESGFAVADEQERAVIVGVDLGGQVWSIDDSLSELERLADTAGAKVVGQLYQKRDRLDAATYIGKGKLEEIRALCQERSADTVIFDDELTPAQQRNIENILGLKVIDRSALILDIFAQRARTHEGKLQVSLAQLQYNLPRIMGQGLVLSRLGGGIGTRGPGETKLEVDRRYIRDRISDIKKELEQVKKVRQLHRQQRRAGNILQISIVGYTNAGKSTLLNSLTETSSKVYEADKLFATLDPTTRMLKLDNQQEVLLTDTVGFIQKLPHQLIAAFRATLEEVIWADLLLHVVDISCPLYQEQIQAVNKVLSELGITDKKIIMVYNKMDLQTDATLLDLIARQPDTVLTSAKRGQGFAKLHDLIAQNLSMLTVTKTLLIHYDKAHLTAQIYKFAKVLSSQYQEDGTCILLQALPEDLTDYLEYIVEK